MIAAILGIAAVPTAGYSASTRAQTKKETKAQKLARELKACNCQGRLRFDPVVPVENWGLAEGAGLRA
jgi:hypothetical protein